MWEVLTKKVSVLSSCVSSSAFNLLLNLDLFQVINSTQAAGVMAVNNNNNANNNFKAILRCGRINRKTRTSFPPKSHLQKGGEEEDGVLLVISITILLLLILFSF